MSNTVSLQKHGGDGILITPSNTVPKDLFYIEIYLTFVSLY